MEAYIKTFIDRLESLPDKPSLDVLKKSVLEIDGRKLPVEEYISFSEQEYKRNIVHFSDKCEVAVLCFKKGQITPIHDHGGSIGITIITKGTMTEELFIRQSTGMISPTFNRRYHAAELAYVNLTTIHRVSNVHNEGLVTINIYFPPLKLMNFYNLENTHVEKWIADSTGMKDTRMRELH